MRHTSGRGNLDRVKLELRRSIGPAVLFVLLVVGGVLTAANIIRNLAGDKPWVDYRQYQVAVENAKGVTPGRVELRIAGVKAGSIKQARVIDGRPVLTLNVEKKYAPLYRDAQVRIRPVTPLEDMYVDIESRGHRSAGEIGSDEILSARETVSPVEVGRVLNVFEPDTRRRLASLLEGLRRGTDDNGDRLRAAFVQIAPFLRQTGRMSEALASRRRQLARLIHNFGGLSEALATRDEQLAGFVQHGQETVTELARNDGPLNETIAQLPPMLSSLQSSFARLEATEDHLDPAIAALHPVAERLPEGLDALQRVSRDATPALNALRKPVRTLRPLARTLRPTARDVHAAFRPLERQSKQIDSATKLPLPCLKELGKFPSRIMSLTKFSDNVGDATKTPVAQIRVGAVGVDIHSAGGVLKDPAWTTQQPCFTRPDPGKDGR